MSSETGTLIQNPWPRPDDDMGGAFELRQQNIPEAKAVLSTSRQGGPYSAMFVNGGVTL